METYDQNLKEVREQVGGYMGQKHILEERSCVKDSREEAYA